jgi:hypothetical protein
MEEEAKLEFTIAVNWRREDGSIATMQLGTLDRGACLLGRKCGFATRGRRANSRAATRGCGQRTTARYYEAVRPSPPLSASAPPLRYGLWEARGVRTPRFDGCRHCGQQLIASPISELLPERVSPGLRHLQAELAAQRPCRQAAALRVTLMFVP